MRNSLLFSGMGLAVSIFLHYERSLDWAVQAYFLSSNGWIIDENERIGKGIFYQGPKVLLVGFGIALLAAALVSIARKGQSWKRAIYALICLGSVPLLIGLAKDFTNEACPKELAAFGGPIQLGQMLGRCFPGGHAAGGFALFCLYWCLNQRKVALLPGFLAGTILGFYQVLKGAHFISDTLCTGFFAWFFCELAWIFSKKMQGVSGRLTRAPKLMSQE